MIPDVHLQRFLHLIKSGPSPRTCQAWGPLVNNKEAFVILINYSDFPEDKADICIREKS